MKNFPLAAIATCLGISGAAIGCSTQATQTSSSPLVELRPLSIASFNEAACPEFDENGDVGDGWLLTADAEEQCQLEGSGLSVASLTSHPGGAGKTLQEILDRCGGFIDWCRGVKKAKKTADPTPEPPPKNPDDRDPFGQAKCTDRDGPCRGMYPFQICDYKPMEGYTPHAFCLPQAVPAGACECLHILQR